MRRRLLEFVTVRDVSIIYTYFTYKQIHGAIKRITAFWNDRHPLLKQREDIFAIWDLGKEHSKWGSDSQRMEMKTGFERSKIFSHLTEGIVIYLVLALN